MCRGYCRHGHEDAGNTKENRGPGCYGAQGLTGFSGLSGLTGAVNQPFKQALVEVVGQGFRYAEPCFSIEIQGRFVGPGYLKAEPADSLIPQHVYELSEKTAGQSLAP